MLGTVVTTMARGQITLPKKIREKLNIKPGTSLNIELKNGSALITPLEKMVNIGGEVIEPTMSKEEHVEFLKSFKGGFWTKKDDLARKKAERNRRNFNW